MRYASQAPVSAETEGLSYSLQVLRLLGALNKALAAPIKSKSAVLYSLNDFLFEYKIDHFNLFEVPRHCGCLRISIGVSGGGVVQSLVDCPEAARLY